MMPHRTFPDNAVTSLEELGVATASPAVSFFESELCTTSKRCTLLELDTGISARLQIAARIPFIGIFELLVERDIDTVLLVGMPFELVLLVERDIDTAVLAGDVSVELAGDVAVVLAVTVLPTVDEMCFELVLLVERDIDTVVLAVTVLPTVGEMFFGFVLLVERDIDTAVLVGEMLLAAAASCCLDDLDLEL
jgi:hypothetical protein